MPHILQMKKLRVRVSSITSAQWQAKRRCPFLIFPVQSFILYHSTSGIRHVLYFNPYMMKRTACPVSLNIPPEGHMIESHPTMDSERLPYSKFRHWIWFFFFKLNFALNTSLNQSKLSVTCLFIIWAGQIFSRGKKASGQVLPILIFSMN